MISGLRSCAVRKAVLSDAETRMLDENSFSSDAKKRRKRIFGRRRSGRDSRNLFSSSGVRMCPRSLKIFLYLSRSSPAFFRITSGWFL